MGTFIVFIIKSAVCLIVFYLFYKLLLSKETFHRFNRIALLSIIVLSVVVPYVVIRFRPASQPEHTQLQENVVIQAPSSELVYSNTTTPVAIQPKAESSHLWLLVLLVTYLAGIVFCLTRQLGSLIRMFRLMRSSVASQMDHNATLLVHTKNITPFSWMNKIVISEKDLEVDGKEILTHELAHIQNKHSWDLLIADCLISFQWFNPAAWLLKQELQSIHEFEADERVLNQGIDAKRYQLLLIKKAVGTRLYSMANSFNQSSLKKRITMMLKEKSSPWARLKYVYILPLACIAMIAFAHPSVSDATANTVEKVDEILSAAPKVNVAVLIPSANKIMENSGNSNISKIKVNSVNANISESRNSERTATDTLLAVTNAQVSTTTQKTNSATTPDTITVIGKVVRSSDGKPLSTVSIREIDPSTHRILSYSVTKMDGTFILKVKNKSNTLKFSCPGYNDALCSVLKRSITVPMEEAVLQLNETTVFGAASQAIEKNVATPVKAETELSIMQTPAYPGGEKGLMEYIQNNLRYPTNAIDSGVSGRVVCSFIISAQGEVTDVKVLTSVHPSLDKEAMRLILNMPNWIPGKQNGKNVSVKYSIPISFKLAR